MYDDEEIEDDSSNNLIPYMRPNDINLYASGIFIKIFVLGV